MSMQIIALFLLLGYTTVSALELPPASPGELVPRIAGVDKKTSAPTKKSDADLLKEQQNIEKQCNFIQIRTDLMKGYDKEARPSKGGPPDGIFVAMEVLSVQALNSKTQTAPFDFMLTLKWTDNRLKFKPLCQRMRAEVGKIWIPDWYINNAGHLMGKIMGKDTVFINADGTIEYSVRIQGDLKCVMDFKSFPFDDQECPVRVGAMFLGPDKQTFKFSNDKASVSFGGDPEKLGGNEWEFIEHSITEHAENNLLSFDFSFTRMSNSYVKDFVFPAGIMFLMVECGFFMDLRFNPALPARAAIAIIPVLILTTQTSAAKGQVPKIDYNTWLSTFLSASLAFMAYGLIELTLTLYGVNRKKEVLAAKGTPSCFIEGLTHLDRYSLIIFPIASALFFGIMLGTAYSS